MKIDKLGSVFVLAVGALLAQACGGEGSPSPGAEQGPLRDGDGNDCNDGGTPTDPTDPGDAGGGGGDGGSPGTGDPGTPACTVRVAKASDVNSAKPGDVVCFESSMKKARLKITKGGTADKPITYSGEGATVDGIDVETSYVVVQNFKMTGPQAPGIWAEGNNITLQNNTITKPVDGDGDGMRFFGNNIKILHNTVSGTSNQYGHADCMQTYASDTPASQNVLIEGNRCEKIDNMCLMAEGPNDGEGDGQGNTDHFTIRNNYCETLKAGQALMIEDIQYCTITGNEFVGSIDKAIGLAINSTNATVSGNKVDSRIGYEVGIDSSSKKGYKGPEPGGEP